MSQNRGFNNDYIALDNSSIIYPPTEARYNSNVFRLSVELKERVKPLLLEKALDDLLVRLPYFKSRLREGFFWFYLSPNKNEPRVFEDGARPCERLLRKKENRKFLFRVSYSVNRIAVDFFHALTDGGGGKIFLLSLVARYFELQGYTIEASGDIISCKSRPQKWETQDIFQKLYRNLPFPDKIRKSFHYRGKKADRTFFISGEINKKELKAVSRKNGATINELFCAILIQILLKKEKEQGGRKPVQISVPLGLRPIFGLNTLRNFSLFAILGIDPRLGEYTFEEIIRRLHIQMQIQTDKKELGRNISRNVMGERLTVIRLVPNLLKKPFFKILTDALGDSQYTTTLSNLGDVKLPPTMEKLVRRFDFFLDPNNKNIFVCSAAGFKDKVFFNFNSYLKDDTSVEREFFSTLVQWGVPVKVYTNRRSE